MRQRVVKSPRGWKVHWLLGKSHQHQPFKHVKIKDKPSHLPVCDSSDCGTSTDTTLTVSYPECKNLDPEYSRLQTKVWCNGMCMSCHGFSRKCWLPAQVPPLVKWCISYTNTTSSLVLKLLQQMLSFNNVVVQILKVIKNRLQLFSMSFGFTGTPSNTQWSHLDFTSLITYAREIIIITADFF